MPNKQDSLPGMEDTQSPLGKQAVACYLEDKKLQVQQSKLDSEDAKLMAMLKKEGKKTIKIKTDDEKIVTLNWKRTHTRTKEKIVIKEVEDI